MICDWCQPLTIYQLSGWIIYTIIWFIFLYWFIEVNR